MNGTPPTLGETFAAVMHRSGSDTIDDGKSWIALVVMQLFEESAERAPLEERLQEFDRLIAERTGTDTQELEAFYDLVVDYWGVACHHAALCGYALGRTEGLPEEMRVAAAKAFAHRPALPRLADAP